MARRLLRYNAEALGICVFTSTFTYAVTPKNMAEMFSAAIRIELTEDAIMLTGRRILTLEKAYNVREGADRTFDDLPWRLMYEPAPTGPAKGMISPEELNKMLNKYYALHEWDLETSWPYKETLDRLELNESCRYFGKIREASEKNQ